MAARYDTVVLLPAPLWPATATVRRTATSGDAHQRPVQVEHAGVQEQHAHRVAVEHGVDHVIGDPRANIDAHRAGALHHQRHDVVSKHHGVVIERDELGDRVQ